MRHHIIRLIVSNRFDDPLEIKKMTRKVVKGHIFIIRNIFRSGQKRLSFNCETSTSFVSIFTKIEPFQVTWSRIFHVKALQHYIGHVTYPIIGRTKYINPVSGHFLPEITFSWVTWLGGDVILGPNYIKNWHPSYNLQITFCVQKWDYGSKKEIPLNWCRFRIF